MRVSRSLITPWYWRGSGASESRGGQLESFITLHDRESNEISPIFTVEFAGADHERRALDDLTRQRPSVETLLRAPEIERTFGRRGVDTEVAKRVRNQQQSTPISLALDVDVFVIVVGERDGGLHGGRHHEAGVLAYRFEEADQLFVAGVEARAQAGQVRSFRARVDRENTVAAVFEDRPRWTGPGVVRVTLVTGDRHAVFTAPRSNSFQVVEVPGGVRR